MSDANQRDEREHAADALINDAWRSYPLEAVPPRLHAAVMTRIRSLPPPQPFRLAWIDASLGLFLVIMAALLLATGIAPLQLGDMLQLDLSPATASSPHAPPVLWGGLALLIASACLTAIVIFDHKTDW
jgi:hypothetical protein